MAVWVNSIHIGWWMTGAIFASAGMLSIRKWDQRKPPR